MEKSESLRNILRGTVFVLMASVPAMTGCGNFFIPVCQAYNTCTTTTSTTPTSTTPTSTTPTGTTPTGTTPTGTTPTGTTPTGSGITPSVARSGQPASLFFVASAQQKSITPYVVAGGQIRSAAAPLMMQNSSPTAVAAAPDGDLFYAATASGAIYLYRIGSSGRLQQTNSGAAVAHVDQPVRMTLDRSGNWLFVASSSTPQLFQFRVNAATGALQRMNAASTSLSAPAAAEIYLPPDNRNLFVALGSGGVDAFSFDPASGTIGAMSHIAPRGSGKAQDTALTSDPSSRLLFVGERGSGIRVLRIVTDGVLQEIAGSPFTAPKLENAAALAVEPANYQLLMADSGSDSIQQFSIAANGALTLRSTRASNVAASPAALSLAATGNDLVGVSGGSTPSLKLIGF